MAGARPPGLPGGPAAPCGAGKEPGPGAARCVLLEYHPHLPLLSEMWSVRVDSRTPREQPHIDETISLRCVFDELPDVCPQRRKKSQARAYSTLRPSERLSVYQCYPSHTHTNNS